MKTVARRRQARAPDRPQLRSIWRKVAARRPDKVRADLVRWWSDRIASQARSAVRLAERYRALTGSREDRLEAIGRHFGLYEGHAFHAEPVRWLSPTEAQVTRAWAELLNAGGAPRILAFLRAIDPTFPWPADLSSARALAEVRTRKGRIDLLVTGTAGGATWGAVIEAKFGHGIDANPLPDYIRHVRAMGMTVAPLASDPASCRFVVVGQKQSKGVRRRLARNRRWRFLAWKSLLRRFEREMSGLPDDDRFRQCRRTTWERAL